MQKILESTDATGKEFSTPGGVCLIQLENHAGSTWQLEAMKIDKTGWVEDQMTFDDDGLKAWWSAHEVIYRLTGGSVGAEAYLISVKDVGNRQ